MAEIDIISCSYYRDALNDAKTKSSDHSRGGDTEVHKIVSCNFPRCGVSAFALAREGKITKSGIQSGEYCQNQSE